MHRAVQARSFSDANQTVQIAEIHTALAKTRTGRNLPILSSRLAFARDSSISFTNGSFLFLARNRYFSFCTSESASLILFVCGSRSALLFWRCVDPADAKQTDTGAGRAIYILTCRQVERSLASAVPFAPRGQRVAQVSCVSYRIVSYLGAANCESRYGSRSLQRPRS